MIGSRADHADANPVALIPASESIDNIDAISGVQIVNGTFAIDTPDLDDMGQPWQ